MDGKVWILHHKLLENLLKMLTFFFLQETSDDIYQCGPCPLIAIKNGEKDITYDLEFIYSEVSADVK